jgi:PPOX class probable FMN-dependent enzyme
MDRRDHGCYLSYTATDPLGRNAMPGIDVKAPVTDADTLRQLYGEPLDLAVKSRLPALDKHHKQFIAHSPFICLATADVDGQPAVSPKGDAPGFVQVVDDNTLVIPDRAGNRQIRGLLNLVENPKIAIIFFIPGVSEVLRVEGTARIVLDCDILEAHKVKSKLPTSALVINVELAYIHCGRAIIRAKLWDPESRVPKGTIASLGQMAADQAKPKDMTAKEIDKLVDHVYGEGLYG